MQRFADQLPKMEASLRSFRGERRGTWEKLALLSAGIVSFSATLLGSSSTVVGNIVYLKASWILLLFNLLLGFGLLILESLTTVYRQAKATSWSFDMDDIEADFRAKKIDQQTYSEKMTAAILSFSPEIASDKGKQLVEKYRSQLATFTFVKESWYSCLFPHVQKIEIAFYLTFLIGLTLLVAAVL